MTISSSEIRRNMTILLDDDLYQILDWQHRQAPKAPPTLTLKVRQVSTGNVYERKLPGNQKLTTAPTERRSVQYLYAEGDLYFTWCKDAESYDRELVNMCTAYEAAPAFTAIDIEEKTVTRYFEDRCVLFIDPENCPKEIE